MQELRSAAVLILDSRKRIFVLDNPVHGGVGMPGGKQEPDGETIVQTAIRELLEEGNGQAKTEDLRLLFAARWTFRRKDGQPGPERLAHLYYAGAVEGTLRSMEAGVNAYWMYYDDLLKRSPFADYYKAALHNGQLLAHLSPTVGFKIGCVATVKAENGRACGKDTEYRVTWHDGQTNDVCLGCAQRFRMEAQDLKSPLKIERLDQLVERKAG